MKITLTERVYTVDDKNYKRKFVYGANGISIPGTHGNGLHFSNAKKQMVKSFHSALGMFLDKITLLDLESCVNSDDIIIGGKRKTEALQFLKDNGMDTPENRALINAVQFTQNAIEIGGVKWAHDNLKASDVGMNYSTDTNAQPKNYEEAHVFKGEGIFAQEDYFTREAINTLPANKKSKIPTYKDMRKTLAAIPGGPVGQTVPTTESSTSQTKGSAKILSILLGTQMSGYRRAGERNSRTKFGFLRSVSPHVSDTSSAWACRRGSSEGGLDFYGRENAFPCRPLA